MPSDNLILKFEAIFEKVEHFAISDTLGTAGSNLPYEVNRYVNIMMTEKTVDFANNFKDLLGVTQETPEKAYEKL